MLDFQEQEFVSVVRLCMCHLDQGSGRPMKLSQAIIQVNLETLPFIESPTAPVGG